MGLPNFLLHHDPSQISETTTHSKSEKEHYYRSWFSHAVSFLIFAEILIQGQENLYIFFTERHQRQPDPQPEVSKLTLAGASSTARLHVSATGGGRAQLPVLPEAMQQPQQLRTEDRDFSH